MMTQSNTNIAAPVLMLQLGILWKTAWLLKYKLLELMLQREVSRPLHDDVRVDDFYLNGERTCGGRGRGS
jgi:hypothetical protein